MGKMENTNARVLIIEDNPDYSELLKESFEERDYQDISIMETSSEARTILSKQFFDVIIADMRLGDEQDGGFAVLHEIKKQNITSIVIILTANDNIADCRLAFREGVWDYISKNARGDVLASLHESIMDAITYTDKWGAQEDNMWIQEHWDELLEEYSNKYIAVINKNVIDSDEDEAALKHRIHKQKLRLLLPVIQKVTMKSIENLSVSELIRMDESQHLEFKSSFGCNGPENRDVQMSTLKNITGFLNAFGGILLIGIEDNGNVCGLEKDFALLKRKNTDGFENHLTGFIKNQIGDEFCSFIKIEFDKIDEKHICVVKVSKASSPAFAQEYSKKGKGKKHFFLRTGNSISSLDVESTYRHLKMKGRL